MSRRLKLTLENGGKVSALLDSPRQVKAAVALAHGAGAGMSHSFLSDLAAGLVREGVAVLRFQFPYMEARRHRPDPPGIAAQAIAAACRELQRRFPKRSLFVAGKSFGARMSTQAAAQGLLPERIQGIVCFGFPLHPPGEPGVERAAHLKEVGLPVLFLQGTRDDLCELGRMRRVCKRLRRAKLREIEGADHGFHVLKSSGRTDAKVLAELARRAAEFMCK